MKHRFMRVRDSGRQTSANLGLTDKILYFPSLTFGREDSDASRRFITGDIEIYNRIKQIEIKHRIVGSDNCESVSKILITIQETAGRHTADNLVLTAGRIRAPHPRPDIGGARVREHLVVIRHHPQKKNIENKALQRKAHTIQSDMNACSIQ